MNTIYTYVLDTMADWEIGTAVAELNSGRFFSRPLNFEVRTVALTKEPVKTMGGLTILPDHEIGDVKAEAAVLLILPGAEDWSKSEHGPALDLAEEFLERGTPVAAICGATEAMARRGILDDVEHTSNGREYLKMTCPGYAGEAHYRDELAVTADNLITAGSSSSVAFAYHILRKLDVMKPEALEYWYGYFDRHSQEDVMKLMESLHMG